MAFSICSLFGRVYAISACHSLGKIKIQKNPAIKDWIVENKKNGRPFLLKLENSLKLKRLQVNELWSSLRYLAKTSLFSAFWKQRKFFCSPERTFSPKQTQNPLKKDSNLRLFKKDAKVGGCHSITSRIFIKYFHEDFYMYNILLKIITYHQKKQIPES